MVVVYGYMCEAFFGWYTGNEYERFMLKNRIYLRAVRLVGTGC